MFLQGDLQLVFDALFHMGVIDPVLQMDWQKAWSDMSEFEQTVSEAVHVANSHQGDLQTLIGKLGKFDEETLQYLAMEVAREYADFHARGDLH